MKNKTEEIQYLGAMLAATTEEDTHRLVGIQATLSGLVNDGWRILSLESHGDLPMCVVAAKSNDGVGVMARWMRAPEHEWSVRVWHTEMPSESLTEDDSDDVPALPPILSLNTKNEISPNEALALFAESKARKIDVYFRDHVDSDWEEGKLTGIRSQPLPFVGHHAHQPASAGTTEFRFCAIRRDQECYKYGGICKFSCHGQCKESC